MNTFIIAEAACTWQCSHEPLKRYKELCQAVSKLGCSALKTQWVSDPRRMAARRHFDGNPYYYLNWPEVWMKDMAQQCADHGVEFMCTTFLQEDIAIVAPFVNRFKVASLEALAIEFVNAHYDYERPAQPRKTLISCGAMTWDEFSHLQSSVHLRYPEWLHCVCSYPAAVKDLNLLCGDAISRRLFNGFSDHSANILTGAVAVAAGYSILEVHIRHDLTPQENPDYGHSLTVDQLRQYVDNVRFAETALGNGIKTVEHCEEPLRWHRVIT